MSARTAWYALLCFRWMVVFVCFGLAQSAALANNDPKIDRARELLNMFFDGNYEGFVGAGTETMREKLTVQMAQQAAMQLEGMVGKFRSEKSVKLTEDRAGDSVFFELFCERGILKLQVVLDQEGRLAGFWTRGIEPLASYKPPDYVDRNAFRDERIAVVSGAFELPGTLSLPMAKAPHAAVVLVHGSGPHDEDETIFEIKPFRDLAWGLASRGVAVLRYEKRTHKYADQINVESLTLDDETIDDALAGVKLLRGRSEIDPQRVYVLGHSLGGMAAPLIARRETQLAGIIIMAGNARPLVDVIDDQIEYIARADGEYSNEERAMVDSIRTATAAIREGRPQDVTGPVLGAPAAYWARLNEIDHVGVAEQLELPMLILHGRRDYQVTMKDFEQWQKRLGDREHVTFRLYERLNHLMVAGDGPSIPVEYMQGGHVDVQVVSDVAQWILRDSRRP